MFMTSTARPFPNRWTLLAMGLLAGCQDAPEQGPGPDPLPISTAAAKLVRIDDCEALERTLRENALQEMRRQIAEGRKQALRDLGQPCYDFDYRFWEDCQGCEVAAQAGPSATPPGAQASGAQGRSNGPDETSGTNNQIGGVDEADFVKEDGQHIYIAKGSLLRVLRSWPANESAEIGRVEIEGVAKKLFVHGDRALVYSSLRSSGESGNERLAGPSWGYHGNECTYGYSCQLTGDGYPTLLTVFDISDRAHPQLLRTLRTTGSLIAARRVGTAIHSVVSSPEHRIPDLEYWPTDIDLYSCDDRPSAAEVNAAYDELERKNEALIAAHDLSGWLPTLVDTLYDGDQATERESVLAECGGFYASPLQDGNQRTSVISLSIDTDAEPSVATVVSPPGTVFASAQALYMAVPRTRRDYAPWFAELDTLDHTSTIHKFDLDNQSASVRYVASGVVKGQVLNQFSMDEHVYEEADGERPYLRIATTSGRVPDPNVHSTLTILVQEADDESEVDRLAETGRVDNIAKTEDIRSVRFNEKRAFVVTFKKTDPLFVFDLSDPRAPKTRGELKIPGFSTYMHMLDDTHLLSIGYDADDQESFAWFTGVLLQIFDVSDPDNPTRTFLHTIGTRGSSSEALTNHLAFTYFPKKKALALPMTICEGSAGGGSYGTEMTFSGLMVFDVSTETGFEERGRVSHLTGDQIPSCNNWWTHATSVVKRSIFMDDFVYSISDAQLRVNRLPNLNNVATVSLTDDP